MINEKLGETDQQIADSISVMIDTSSDIQDGVSSYLSLDWVKTDLNTINTVYKAAYTGLNVYNFTTKIFARDFSIPFERVQSYITWVLRVYSVAMKITFENMNKIYTLVNTTIVSFLNGKTDKEKPEDD